MPESDAQHIAWTHGKDDCEAELGEPLRWRAAATDKRPRVGMWQRGRTVRAIVDDGTTWTVYLDEEERADGWNSRITCGRARVLR
jgi:hypothetical protein